MLVHRENTPRPEPTPSEVLGYIEDMVIELADLASMYGRTALAASLSIVAVQAAAERRLTPRDD